MKIAIVDDEVLVRVGIRSIIEWEKHDCCIIWEAGSGAEALEKYEAEQAKKPVATWAQEAVDYVKAEGLMSGDTDGSFRPQSPITRQEVAAVLKNAFDK